jgi:cell division protein FtsL
MTPPAAAAAPAIRPRRAPAPRGPRRISGPARPATAPRRPATGVAADRAGLVVGLLSALESLAQHRLLDRLIRGRVWIGLVAFALIGIVTLQLGLLKLNGGIGRALEHEALLQRENASLSIENSELAAGTRVEKGAAKLGMAFVPAGALRFLSAGGHGDAGKAAASLASAAHATAQAREAHAAEAASSSPREASEGEASSETATTSAGTGEESSAASASSGGSEEAGSSGESSTSSESSASSEASSGESAPEAASAASTETEPSGGSAAGSSGG